MPKKSISRNGGQGQSTFAQDYSTFAQDYHVPSVTLRQLFALDDTIALLMSLLPKFAEAITNLYLLLIKSNELLQTFTCKSGRKIMSQKSETIRN